MKEEYIVIDGLTHIGFNVIKELCNQKKKVKTLISKKKYENKLPKDLEVYYGDANKIDNLKEILKKDKKTITYVINCSDFYSIYESDNKKIKDKIESGTKNIIELCIKNEIDKYIHIVNHEGIDNTGMFNNNNINTYYGRCLCVTANEVLNNQDKLNTSIVVHSNVIGTDDYNNNYINNYLYNYYLGNITKFIDGNIYLTDVKSISSSIINAALYGKSSEVYYLLGNSYKISYIFDNFSKIANVNKIKKYYKIENILKKEGLYKKYCDFKKIKPKFNNNSFVNIDRNIILKDNDSYKELDFENKNILETLNDLKLFFDRITKK